MTDMLARSSAGGSSELTTDPRGPLAGGTTNTDPRGGAAAAAITAVRICATMGAPSAVRYGCVVARHAPHRLGQAQWL